MKCPFCSQDMLEGYFIVGGGAWWYESREYLDYSHVESLAVMGERVRTPTPHKAAVFGFAASP